MKMFELHPSLFLCFVFYCVAGCSPGKKDTTVQDSAATEQIGKPAPDGKNVYTIYCQICHGSDGARKLEGKSDLTTSRLDLNTIIEVTREGRNTMTGYKAILSEEELKAVSEFTLQLQK